ncbi:MAG: cation-transporting P-type ATPase [Lysobacteraceae bacterium]
MNADAPARTGLAADEAAARLRRDGANRLPEPERRSRLAIVAKVLGEPMLLLLIAAAAVYLLLGDPLPAATARSGWWPRARSCCWRR